MRRTSLCVALALALLIPGCLGVVSGDDDEAPGAGANDSGEDLSSSQTNEDANDASASSAGSSEQAGSGNASDLFPNATEISGNTTVDDWFALTATAGPGEPVTAFRWTIPEDAVVPAAFFQNYTTVVIDFVPFAKGDPKISSWGVHMFDLSEENASLLASYTSPTVTLHSSFAGTSNQQTISPSLSSLQIRLGNSTEEGDEVGFVVTAESETQTDIGVGLRALPEDPGFEGAPPREIADLREDENGTAPLRVPVEGTGSGFQYAYYFGYHSLFLTGSEIWSSSMEKANQAPANPQPAASVYQSTYSSTFESETGWGVGDSFYWSEAAAGVWAVDTTVHGASLQEDGVTAQLPSSAGIATTLLLGYPSHLAIAGGEGGSELTFTLDAVSANEFEYLLVAQSDLGVSLEELFGQPSEDYAAAFNGLAGVVAPTAGLHVEDGRAWVLQPEGPTIGFHGPPAR